MTKIVNHVYYLICLLIAVYAALPASAIEILPTKWKPYLVGAALAAGWLKSHWNLFINPDGTPARTAYIEEKK